jgi:hypothetical protein
MISRASTRVGNPASIAATVTVSALVSKSRPIVMRRAIVLADAGEGFVRRPFQPVVYESPTR